MSQRQEARAPRRHAIIDLVHGLMGQGNVIPVPRELVRLLGGNVTAAMVYMQLAYWEPKAAGPWLYKSRRELADELGLSEDQVRTASNALKAAGFIDTQLKKANGTPTLHYRLNREALVKALLASQTDLGDNPNGIGISDKSLTGDYKQEITATNPSSTDVDAGAQGQASSEEEAPSTPSSPPAPSSPKDPPPRSAAPPSRAKVHLAELQELVDVWNAHKGKLREFKSLGAKRTRNLQRLVAECAAAGADPLAVVKLAATTLAEDDHYVRGGYDLENVIQSGRLAKFIDDALTAPPEQALVAGARYSWPRDPGRPWAGAYTGTYAGVVVEVRGKPFALMRVDPGQATNASEARVAVGNLTAEEA